MIVIAKNDMAHISLAEQIRTKNARRSYLALVENCFTQLKGTLETGYGRDAKDRLKMSVYPMPKQEDESVRIAKTDYMVLEQFPGSRSYALVRCDLHTGRTHQIRVHMAYLKHPIVGDKTYGSKSRSLRWRVSFFMLEQLNIRHPRTGQDMEFYAPLPDYFCEVLEKLRNRKK